MAAARTPDRRRRRAEVALDYVRMIDDIARFPARDHASELERNQLVRYRGDERDIVLDDEQRGPSAIADVHQNRTERFRFALRKSGRRLVQKQHLRIVRERA